LVVGDVCAETSQRREAEVHRSQKIDEFASIVLPAEPSTMSSIQIHSDVEVFELIDCVGNTGLVRVGSSGVSTAGDTRVGGQVRQRVGLNDEHNFDFCVVLLHDVVEDVDVFSLVLGEASGAVTWGCVVTGAVSVVSTADLAI
jgi:hypothetical protein